MEHGGFQKMDFSIKTADKKNSLDMIDTDCIVIGIYDDHKLTDAAIALDTNGVITRALESGDISGKAGSALLVGFPEKIAAKRLLLLGLGKKPTAEIDFRQAIDTAIKTVKPLFSATSRKRAIFARSGAGMPAME